MWSYMVLTIIIILFLNFFYFNQKNKLCQNMPHYNSITVCGAKQEGYYARTCLIITQSRSVEPNKSAINPFRLSFSEPKCARGGHIIFLESIFQHSPHEIVIYSINRKSYNKKSKHFIKLNKCATDSSIIYE